jgi:hypothetical protein
MQREDECESWKYGLWERGALSLVGTLCMALAAWLWVHPGKRDVVLPACSKKNVCTAAVSAEPTSVVLLLVGLGAGLLFFGVNGRRLKSVKLPGGAESTFADEEKRSAKRILGANPDALAELPMSSCRPSSRDLLTSDTEVLEQVKDDQPSKAEGAPDLRTADHPNRTTWSDGAHELAAVQADPMAAAEATDTIDVAGEKVRVYSRSAMPTRVLSDLLRKAKDLPRECGVEFVARKAASGNQPWLVKFLGDKRIWKVAYTGQSKDAATVTVLELRSGSWHPRQG